jgi:hypothetical protein
LFVQIQKCVIWKISNLDKIRYDDKLKKEEHEENIDDNDDKQEIQPPPGLSQIAGLGWMRICYHYLLTHQLLQHI